MAATIEHRNVKVKAEEGCIGIGLSKWRANVFRFRDYLTSIAAIREAPRSHRDERRMPVFGNRRRRTIDLKNVLPHRALGRRVRTENRNSFSVLKVVAR